MTDLLTKFHNAKEISLRLTILTHGIIIEFIFEINELIIIFVAINTYSYEKDIFYCDTYKYDACVM